MLVSRSIPRSHRNIVTSPTGNSHIEAIPSAQIGCETERDVARAPVVWIYAVQTVTVWVWFDSQNRKLVIRNDLLRKRRCRTNKAIENISSVRYTFAFNRPMSNRRDGCTPRKFPICGYIISHKFHCWMTTVPVHVSSTQLCCLPFRLIVDR